MTLALLSIGSPRQNPTPAFPIWLTYSCQSIVCHPFSPLSPSDPPWAHHSSKEVLGHFHDHGAAFSVVAPSAASDVIPRGIPSVPPLTLWYDYSVMRK